MKSVYHGVRFIWSVDPWLPSKSKLFVGRVIDRVKAVVISRHVSNFSARWRRTFLRHALQLTWKVRGSYLCSPAFTSATLSFGLFEWFRLAVDCEFRSQTWLRQGAAPFKAAMRKSRNDPEIVVHWKSSSLKWAWNLIAPMRFVWKRIGKFDFHATVFRLKGSPTVLQ